MRKPQWLAAQGVSYDRLRRWRLAVFDGDLDRGLVLQDFGYFPARHPPGACGVVSGWHRERHVPVAISALQLFQLVQRDRMEARRREALVELAALQNELGLME